MRLFIVILLLLTTLHRQCQSFVSPTSRHVATSTALFDNLWDRLEIEEDTEMHWYLLNCVATLEFDLRNQCRQRMTEDVDRFIVPYDILTRSHGANKMVSEKKVKYPGYVFAKLRLCEQVYESIRSLDLCRSWMGTVNQRGLRKLPPAPLPLSADEIERFGLEEWVEDEEDYSNNADINDNTSETRLVHVKDAKKENQVIVDEPDRKDNTAIDNKRLEVYQGFKVGDMVKVTAKNKFFDEDAIVRRLKNGQLFLRFYTYGSIFEEWLSPSDVRKLTEQEAIMGLGGPAEPITQQDFDGRNNDYNNDSQPQSIRRSLTTPVRNRRQDRTERTFTNGRTNEDEKNWNWYKDKQQQDRFDKRAGFRDDGGNALFGSNDNRNDRSSGVRDYRNNRNNNDRSSNERASNNRERTWQSRNTMDNRKNEAAIQGDGDWSAFVTSAGGGATNKQSTSKKDSDDDFFAFLMSDLSKDLSGSNNESKKRPVKKADNDGFFDDLVAELDQQPPPSRDDDFFSSLEAELDNVLSTTTTTTTTKSSNARTNSPRISSSPRTSSPRTGSPRTSRPEPQYEKSIPDDNDDFFSSLEAELNEALSMPSTSASSVVESVDTFATESIVESADSKSRASTKSKSQQSTNDLEKNTVPVLKEMLKERGLKVSGKKAELIERLLQNNQ